MSVAPELPPAVPWPHPRPRDDEAVVIPFRRPGATPPLRLVEPPAEQEPAPPPLRLTRRGRIVVAVLGVLLVGLLVWASSRIAEARSTVPGSAPSVVEVQPGDTLWSIARRVAPDADTRLVVADLQRRNGLSDTSVVPGQCLVVHP